MILFESNMTGADILRTNPSLWNNITAFWKKMTFPVLASVANTILQTASKFSPPGRNKKLGYATIPDDMYYCQIINIDALVQLYLRRQKPTIKNGAFNNEKLLPRFKKTVYKRKWDKELKKYLKVGNKLIYDATGEIHLELDNINKVVKNTLPRDKDIKIYKEDWAAWRQGNRFKIVTNKTGAPRKTLGYTKTMPLAKKMARILNRGLAKYSWGTLLRSLSDDQTLDENPTIGSTTSVAAHATFQTLLRKSPNIARYNWGVMKYNGSDMKNLNWTLLGYTQYGANEPYAKIALNKGMVEGAKKYKRLMNAFAHQNTKSILRLFGDTFRSVINKDE